MATQPRRAAKRRQTLTRDRLLRAAIGLADRGGFESLSMRNLGSKLGVEAMSLYNHVRNKEDLLDGMVDVVFSEVDLPPIGPDWRTAARTRAVSLHQVLLRHPWANGLMESRTTPGPANLRHHNAVLGSLRGAGFSVEMAAHAYSVLDSYIYGFTLTETTLPFRKPGEVAEVAANILEGFRTGEYPYLAEMAVDRAMKPGYSYGVEFEYGLDLILDGIRRAQERTEPHAAKPASSPGATNSRR